MTAPTEASPRGVVAELPHDHHAEQCALGAVLLSREVREHVFDIVTPSDFHDPRHAAIAAAVVHMMEAGSPVDAVTVNAELARRGDALTVGGAPYLHTLTEAVPSTANGGYYARLVADAAARARLVQTGARIAQLGHTDADVPDLHERARQAVDDASGAHTGATDELVSLGDLIPAVIDELQHGTVADDGAIGVPYADLAEFVPTLRPGQLITIGARPGVGKTMVALDFARHAAKQDTPALFASLEMTRAELGHRILAAEARINLSRFTGQAEPFTNSEWDRLAPHIGRLTELPIVIDDDPHCSLHHLRARLRGLARTHPPGLLIIDYLQLMTMPRADNREQQIAATSRGLKLLAREFNIPIVLLAQLNRAVEGRHDKLPQLSDFRESGAIEQDSNIALMLHRPEIEAPETRAGELDIRVAKNRGGPLGITTVAAQTHYARCVDLARYGGT